MQSMQSALEAFDNSLTRVRHMHGLHNTLTVTLTSAVDLSDILRAEIVMAVSALDYYIHEIARIGMLECWAGKRAITDAFKRFPLTLAAAQSLAHDASAATILDNEIRAKHGYASFQKPDKIADAVRLFSSISLWDDVGRHLGKSPQDVKASLGLIIDRRNKIAHEADVDPSFPDQLWPVSSSVVDRMINDIEAIGHAVHAACNLD
ncbi:HEPN domain-containing protein [Swaminathania salitolerans]|uniref:RiboL-PSP-HEPN domain-containing protein n=1 Tax=Swaminathania salitolerans TaxID=182838 RepID=A0A511BSK5_9PROT|nr:HEPN domain-containing protein [Swaminathania salitolerans]GBQ13289.1 hypothetical protein AA21291_1457 [Swaminathania salitolerans LMG 21291]GEL03270.1 hypothetical protein SSA02_24330 [Swaminathania salitolerans]